MGHFSCRILPHVPQSTLLWPSGVLFSRVFVLPGSSWGWSIRAGFHPIVIRAAVVDTDILLGSVELDIERLPNQALTSVFPL